MFQSLLRATTLAAALVAGNAHADNGDLDPGFGSGGLVIVNYDFTGGNLQEFGNRVLIQPQGYVLIGSAGVTCCATFEYDTAVTRVDRNGAVDASFGLDSGLTRLSATGQYDFIGGASVAPDGSILVGVHGAVGGNPGAVIKLSADGVPDITFGSSGVQTIPNFDVFDVFGLGNGQVLVSGLYNSSYLAVVRLNANGGIDTAFGTQTPTDGFALFGADEVDAMALQADGKMVVAGSANFGTLGGDDFLVVRFTASGALDMTFNNSGTDGGYVRIPFDRCGNNATYDFQNRDIAHALAIEPDGDILVAGTAGGYCDAPTGNLGSAIGVARIHADGTLDSSFGQPLFQLAVGYDTQAAAIVSQGNKIFIAATADGGSPTGNDFTMVRLNRTGTLDVSWAHTGYTHYDSGLSTNDTASGMAFDGTVPVLIGSRNVTVSDTDIAVLRIANDSIFGDGFD